jgi:hypothetical protein
MVFHVLALTTLEKQHALVGFLFALLIHLRQAAGFPFYIHEILYKYCQSEKINALPDYGPSVL